MFYVDVVWPFVFHYVQSFVNFSVCNLCLAVNEETMEAYRMAMQEMYSALKQRKEALEAQLLKKTKLLYQLCVQEAVSCCLYWGMCVFSILLKGNYDICHCFLLHFYLLMLGDIQIMVNNLFSDCCYL